MKLKYIIVGQMEEAEMNFIKTTNDMIEHVIDELPVGDLVFKDYNLRCNLRFSISNNIKVTWRRINDEI